MDEDMCRWILEFVLRSPMNNRALKRLVAVLPFSDNDCRLKKTMLLRTIQNQVSDAVVTETMLENFEIIEELDKNEGLEVMESMKAAYCAVALDCTVKRIWRVRVAEMEKSGKSDLEAALWDTNCWKRLTHINTRNNALRLVEKFLGEAWGILGSSFLQSGTLMDERMSNEVQHDQLDRKSAINEDRGADKTTSGNEDMGGSCRNEMPKFFAEPEKLGGEQHHCEVETKEISSTNISGELSVKDLAIVAVNNEQVQKWVTETSELTDAQGSDKNGKVSDEAILNDPNPSIGGTDNLVANDEESLKCSVLPRHKFLTSHRRSRGGAKISYPEDLENDTLSDAEVSDLAEKNNHELSSEGWNDADTVDPGTNKDNEPLQSRNSSLANRGGGQENIVPRPSLMERNSTARSNEWDDSIDNSPVRIGKHTSPKRKAGSPLKNDEANKFSRRRKIKRWSLLEEDTLRNAVQKYGKGNWKVILNDHRDVFEERTEVDLKDKWRNMTRY